MRGLATDMEPNRSQGDFLRLMKMHRGLIYSLINKYDFIREHEKEDYYQEVVAYIWHRFSRYDSSIASFATWLYKNTEWAVLNYRRSTRKYNDNMINCEDFTTWCRDTYVQYQEEEIESLNLAIQDLPQLKRKVVTMFLDGENLTEHSIKEGKRFDYYKGVLHKARKDILKHHKRYFDGITVQESKLHKIPNGRINEENVTSKPIVMLDLNGKFLKSFPSISEAERNGFSGPSICACARGKVFSHKGFRWMYQGDDVSKIMERVKRKKGRHIVQYSMEGQEISSFPSIVEASKKGFNRHGLIRCLTGRIKQHKGYKWQYAI